jgi:hypothetical protein
MTVVATVVPAGSSCSTTASIVLGAFTPAGHPVVVAECDPSGGDVASWAQLRDSPGWSTAVASGDRSWAGLQTHLQQMPSGLNVLVAPAHAAQAQVVTKAAAKRYGPMLRSMPDVTVIADCGRMTGEVSPWVATADLVLLFVRQSPSEGATVARVDRAGECLTMLRAERLPVGVVVIGVRPYPPEELAGALQSDVFAVLPEDPAGASLAAGAWTVGRGAARSPLARAARPMAERLVDALAGIGSVVPITRDAGSEALG